MKAVLLELRFNNKSRLSADIVVFPEILNGHFDQRMYRPNTIRAEGIHGAWWESKVCNG